MFIVQCRKPRTKLTGAESGRLIQVPAPLLFGIIWFAVWCDLVRRLLVWVGPLLCVRTDINMFSPLPAHPFRHALQPSLFVPQGSPPRLYVYGMGCERVGSGATQCCKA